MRPSLVSLIRASRPLSNHFSKKIASKEEDIAFLRVFQKIMNQTDDDKKPENKNMQLVFEESIDSLKNATTRQRFVDRNTRGTAVKSLNLHNKFSKDLTMKILDDMEKKDKLESALKKVCYNNMDELESSYELTQHLTTLIQDFERILSNKKFKPVKFSNDLLETITNDPKKVLNELTFPLILQHGLTLLQEEFRSKQEALNIIQLLKNQSLKVYFYGLTADIVNLNLQLEWELYGDLNKINLIIDEFKINGIQTNISTLSTLKKISKDYHQCIDPGHHIMDDKNSNSVYNKHDEMELFQIDQYISDLTQLNQ